MKNFEKNFDRLLNNLKEAKDILAECNIEMAKALHVDKETVDKYVLFDKTLCAYVTNDFVMLTLGNIQDAKIFKTKIEATEYKEDLLDKFEDIDCDLVVKKVKLKVVE